MKTLKRIAIFAVCAALLALGVDYIFLTTHVSADEIESIYVYHSENGARVREYSINFTEKKLYTFESTNGENRNNGEDTMQDGYQGVKVLSDSDLEKFVSKANRCAFFAWKLKYVDESIPDVSSYPQWGVEIKYTNSGMSKTVGIGEYPSTYDDMQKIFRDCFGLDIL